MSLVKAAFQDPAAAAAHSPTPNDSRTIQDKLTNLWFQLQTQIETRAGPETTSILLASAAFVVLLMTWSSRFGQWGGRFSPFGRQHGTESTEVSDSDFSYITNDDIRKANAETPSSPDLGPPRDTDVLVLKSKRVSYPVHFPAYCIDKGELLVGSVREQAAKKTGTPDARRIKLFYKGKNLKDDARTCRAEGLRAGGEIMCVIAETQPDSASGSDSEDGGAELDDAAVEGDAPKRKRNRTRNKKKKGKKPSGTSTPSDTLPVPPSNTSRAPSPRLPPTPATPMDKLDALNRTLQGLLPQVVLFTSNPPADAAKKDLEHKKLSETIFMQVMLKLDGVEVEGDAEARQRRKDLVKETQRILNGLDDAVK